MQFSATFKASFLLKIREIRTGNDRFTEDRRGIMQNFFHQSGFSRVRFLRVSGVQFYEV